jgi:acetyl-CoA C-acetyltransferase
MGITAENLAKQYGITREAQDAFALQSQQRAQAAIASGLFKAEIAPVEIKDRKETKIFDSDEHPRATTIESLAKLRPAFDPAGTVTAGNASGINDGAATVILASEDAVKRLGLTPLARIIGFGTASVDPAVMGYGPVPAIQSLAMKTGIALDKVQRFELNEAFASQALSVAKGLGIEDRSADINVRGGAIALGHPIGPCDLAAWPAPRQAEDRPGGSMHRWRSRYRRHGRSSLTFRNHDNEHQSSCSHRGRHHGCRHRLRRFPA